MGAEELQRPRCVRSHPNGRRREVAEVRVVELVQADRPRIGSERNRDPLDSCPVQDSIGHHEPHAERPQDCRVHVRVDDDAAPLAIDRTCQETGRDEVQERRCAGIVRVERRDAVVPHPDEPVVVVEPGHEHEVIVPVLIAPADPLAVGAQAGEGRDVPPEGRAGCQGDLLAKSLDDRRDPRRVEPRRSGRARLGAAVEGVQGQSDRQRRRDAGGDRRSQVAKASQAPAARGGECESPGRQRLQEPEDRGDELEGVGDVRRPERDLVVVEGRTAIALHERDHEEPPPRDQDARDEVDPGERPLRSVASPDRSRNPAERAEADHPRPAGIGLALEGDRGDVTAEALEVLELEGEESNGRVAHDPVGVGQEAAGDEGDRGGGEDPRLDEPVAPARGDREDRDRANRHDGNDHDREDRIRRQDVAGAHHDDRGDRDPTRAAHPGQRLEAGEEGARGQLEIYRERNHVIEGVVQVLGEQRKRQEGDRPRGEQRDRTRESEQPRPEVGRQEELHREEREGRHRFDPAEGKVLGQEDGDQVEVRLPEPRRDPLHRVDPEAGPHGHPRPLVPDQDAHVVPVEAVEQELRSAREDDQGHPQEEQGVEPGTGREPGEGPQALMWNLDR